MLDQLRTRLISLPARERAAAFAGIGLGAVLIIYLVIFLPLHTAVDARAKRVEQKRQQLAWLQGVAPQLQMLAAAQGASGPANESLVVLVDRTARESGLGNAITGQTPNGDAGVRVQMEAAAFDSLVQWLGALHRQQSVVIDSLSIDRTPKDGVVNASIVLNRPH
jgi:general secretion pathway protein M